ncbi:MAG: chemotaxis protein CheW [Methylomonas sp.]|nr:MAG: chemotaxis protein CheW [Methylomonas sp.]
MVTMRKRKKSSDKADIAYLSRFMGAISPDQSRLNEIQAVYDNLTLLGQLLGAGTDITSMRQDFQELAAVLLEQLAKEHYKKATLNLGSCARVAIDILTRNLYERTADIGFLATDIEVCEFAEAVESNPEIKSDPDWLVRLSNHFSEYVAKYSVYHNIILLAPDGEILVQLDPKNPVTKSTDTLIDEALTTNCGFVEVFRQSDLLPQESSPLIYAYRVMSKDGSHPVGVLCLCFRFEDECKLIFDSLLSQDDWLVITLLDNTGKIIATSDVYQFPIGAYLEPVENNQCSIRRFNGREYLTTTHQATSYQGYSGPGWVGHAMAPLNHAFEMAEALELRDVPEDFLAGVLNVATLFSDTLRGIPISASSIQQELNRAVWNGNIWLAREHNSHNSAFAKVLLREIGRTGVRTRNVFSESTTNLYKTVVSSVLFDCSAQASLAIDIMDRNLYERANDCRWWALTRFFREELEPGNASINTAKLTEVLRYINGLYTVYTNLILFDTSGKVIAVSNPAYNDLLSQIISEPWVRPTLALSNPQRYCVSDFAKTNLYINQPTYIYTSAIRSINSAEPVGGIAIVFDSTQQLKAMLNDALPRDENGRLVNGAFAVFVETDGKIISTTCEDLTNGQKLDVNSGFLSLQRGDSVSGIIAYNEIYYAVGSCKSNGYREYKSYGDSYQNEVVALVFTPLSQSVVEDGFYERYNTPAENYALRKPRTTETCDVATFYIGNSLYGLFPGSVIAAIDTDRLTHMPGSSEWVAGCLMYEDEALSVVDISSLLAVNLVEGERRKVRAENGVKKQVLLLRSEEKDISFGVLIDNLGEISEIETNRFEAVPFTINSNSIIHSLVKPENMESARRMLVILSIEKMLERFNLQP